MVFPGRTLEILLILILGLTFMVFLVISWSSSVKKHLAEILKEMQKMRKLQENKEQRDLRAQEEDFVWKKDD